MSDYRFSIDDQHYVIPAEDLPKYEVKTEEKDWVVYSQNDPRWKNKKLGNSKSSTIGRYGCLLTSIAMMDGRPPNVMNSVLKTAGCFTGKYGDLLISEKVVKALGWEYYGREYDINKMPKWTPNIKEVDFSPSRGKQQHFCLRVTINKKRKIIDPIDGNIKAINYYQKKSGKTGFVSYRLFKK